MHHEFFKEFTVYTVLHLANHLWTELDKIEEVPNHKDALEKVQKQQRLLNSLRNILKVVATAFFITI